MNKLHLEAKKLRDSGYSYNMICNKIGVSKSTLSNWFSDYPFTPNREVLNRVQFGPIKSAEKSHNRKANEIKELLEIGAREIGKFSKRDLWILGLGIYMGEGTKSFDNIRIINADPTIIKLAVKWFKDIIGLADSNIAVRLHLYPDNDPLECVTYWKGVTKLPANNFYKPQIDRRENKKNTKRKKLPFGTAHVIIKANGNSAYGVKLFRRIKGWIYGASMQV